MPAYAVTFDEAEFSGVGSRNGVRGAVVFAADANDAKALLKAQGAADIDAAWDGATYTEIAAGANFVGWTLRVAVTHPTTHAEVYDIEVVGAGANDTVDEIAALMVTALEAAGAALLTPSYDAGTNILTVAAIGDAIGDHNLQAFWYPPQDAVNERRISVPGFIGAIVDAGVAAAVLTVTLGADAKTVPAVTTMFKGE
jgi:hypothetical protein